MPDFGGETETFRATARDWLAANFPPALKGTSPPEGREMTADQDAWRKAMGVTGWGVPTWPKAYGGGGLSRAETKVLVEEMTAVGAYNPIGGMGVIMFGPTLLEYGTEAQKQEHIPKFARAERDRKSVV